MSVLSTISRHSITLLRIKPTPLLRKAQYSSISKTIGSQFQQRHYSSNNQGEQFASSRWQIGSSLGAIALALGAVQYHLSSTTRTLQCEASKEISDIKTSDENFRPDPATGQMFPVILENRTSNGSKKLKLIGLGVRTVTFLSVRVYVAGLYVDEKAFEVIQKSSNFKGFESVWMSNKEKDHSGEELVNALLDEGITCAIRIVPVRATDYNHLKGGLTRAVQARAKAAKKANLISPETEEALSRSLQDLSDAFPRATLAKGKMLDLIMSPSSKKGSLDLTLIEDEKVLGHVKAPLSVESQFSVPRQLLLAYLADKDEISKPFKKSVSEGFERIAKGLEQ